MTAASAPSASARWASTGVGTAPSMSRPRRPAPANTAAASRANRSEQRRASWPTSTVPAAARRRTNSASPALARRTVSRFMRSGPGPIGARIPAVPKRRLRSPPPERVCRPAGVPTEIPAPSSRLRLDRVVDERRRLHRRLADRERRADRARAPLGVRGAAREDAGERLAAVHLVTDRDEELDPDRRVDRVLEALPAGAERRGGATDRHRVDGPQVAVAVGRDRPLDGGLGQQREVLGHPRVAALSIDERLEALEPRPARQRLGGAGATLVGVARDPGYRRRTAGEHEAEIGNLAAPLAAQRLDGLDELNRVADESAERPAHVGDERRRPPPRFVADAHAELRE